MFIKPYNDEYMTFNPTTNRYTLTPQAVLDELGIDLKQYSKGDARGIKAFLSRVSALTYKKMHEYGSDDTYQNQVIACTIIGRRIIFEAMIEQCFYMRSVGDLSLSTGEKERKLYASDNLIDIFEEIIPEIGTSIINLSL